MPAEPRQSPGRYDDL